MKTKITILTLFLLLATTSHSECFLELCNSSNTSLPIKRTIENMLLALNAKSCDEANSLILKSEMLDLSFQEISDLTPLSCFTHLKELYLAGNNFTKIDQLEPLENIEILDLSNNDFSTLQNIVPLITMSQLKSLNLRESDLSSITGISFLRSLVDVDLSYNLISDISEINELLNLESLSLLFNSRVRDISPLAYLQKLNSVILFETNIIKDIEHCPYGEGIAKPINLFCKTYIETDKELAGNSSR